MVYKVSTRNISIWGYIDDFLYKGNFTSGSLQLRYVDYIKVSILLPENGSL